MKYLFIFLFLVGCGSAPYRDDYTKHVNLIEGSYFDGASIEFSFAGNQNVDLRGLYSQNDTVGATPVMYQGVGGWAGLLVQLGTHTALVQSQRDEKLFEEQEQANKPILPLINMAKDLPLIDLIRKHSSQLVNLVKPVSVTVNIKPIFFSNSEMTELSLKSVIWLSFKDEGTKWEQKFKYKNMVHVYSKQLNESQHNKLVNGDKDFLSEVLSSLLTTALYITKKELTGEYSTVENQAQTFILKNGKGTKVIRGSVVDEKCGYQIIQDIHSWFIAYPNSEVTTPVYENFTSQC